METKNYEVLWTTYARVALARMRDYKVNPMSVFQRSKSVLILQTREFLIIFSGELIPMKNDKGTDNSDVEHCFIFNTSRGKCRQFAAFIR
jgi:hypothetical protein